MVPHRTSTNDSLWTDVPYFQPEHCARPQYRPTRPAFGNLSMSTTLWPVVNKFLSSPARHRLPPVRLVYETNAVYDPILQTCLEYDGRRFVQATDGHTHHVLSSVDS